MSTDLIVKSNDLVEARYKITAFESKIIALLTSVVNKDDKDFEVHRFLVKDLLRVLGLGEKNYNDLEQITKNLMKKVVLIKRADRTLQISFLSSAEYFRGEGVIELSFDPKLKPYLLNLKENFIKYNFGTILRLQSSYSIRFYELIIKWKSIGKFRLSVNELRLLFGIEEKKYKRYNDFKKAVLLKAKEELKSKTDLYFDFKEVKESRKITYIDFFIRETGQKLSNIRAEKLSISKKPQTLEPDSIKSLVKIGLSEVKAQELADKYSSKRIEKQIEYLPYRKAKNRSAVLIKSIEENWSAPDKYLEENQTDLTKKLNSEKKKKESLEKQREAEELQKQTEYDHYQLEKLIELLEEDPERSQILFEGVVNKFRLSKNMGYKLNAETAIKGNGGQVNFDLLKKASFRWVIWQDLLEAFPEFSCQSYEEWLTSR